MDKTINKILACMLVVTLTFANLILLGTYATESFATSEELESQKTLIKDKVDFDAYFLDEKGNKTHSKTMDITSQDQTLYLSIKVLQGYLRNAKIELTDTNFQLQDVSEKYELIQGISNHEIIFNQMESGNENVFEIPIKVKESESIHLDDFTKQNEIKISGSAIDNNARTSLIENTIETKLNLHGTANPIVQQEITKFTPYRVGEKEGFMIQETVKSGLENNTLPIEKTDLSIAVPTLKDGTKPSKVTVSANSLEATKADREGSGFHSDNWNYDKEKGIVSILVENGKNEQNIVSWGKLDLDEFVITYIFENAAAPTELPIHLEATLNIKAYNNELTEVQKVEQKDITLDQKIGDIVTFEIETMQETLGKGFLYANSNYETEYQTKWIADLGYVDLIDQMTMNQTVDVFVDQNGNKYATTVGEVNNTYYKSTQMAKDNFTKTLGSDENAYIHIYNKATNDLIATINKDTPTDDNGNIIVNYATEINNIYIQTSKPVKEGKLEIQHTKAIKAKTDYGTDQLKSFNAIETNVIGTILSGDTKVVETEKAKKMELTEPNTKVEALVNNAKSINLSTVVKNENVEFKVILKNTDITSDLFKNPVVELVFPSYIKEMNIRNIGLLFDEELKIDQEHIQTYTKEDGRLAMRISFIGTQTVYNFNPTQNGTNIVINADITVEQLTPSVNTIIEAYVTNENATSYEQEKDGKAYQELGANFVAPDGMVTVNSIENYNNKQEKATSISGQEVIGELPIQSESKIAKVTLTVINNYDKECKNINILGRTPTKGNKTIELNQELGSTFTAKLVSGIIAESGIDQKEVTVYYTQNENATNELNNPENGWTTELSNLHEVKSYLIVLNNYEMKKGEAMVFSYQVEIPANLQHNQSAYGTFAVYFDNEAQAQEVQERSVSPKVGVSTMEGPELETSIAADVGNATEIKEGQVVKYTVTVKNVGDTEAKNIKIISEIPDGMLYTELLEGEGTPNYKIDESKQNVEINVETISKGKEFVAEYYLKVKPLEVGITEKNISTNARILLLDSNDEFEIKNKIENKIVKGCLDVLVYTGKEDYASVKENSYVAHTILITNANNEIKTNVKVEHTIPKEYSLEIEEVYLDGQEVKSGIQFNSETNTWKYELAQLEKGQNIKIRLRLKVNTIEDNETEKILQNAIRVSCDQTTEVYTKTINYTVGKPKLEVSQTSDIMEGHIKEEDRLVYTIKVKNTGKGTASKVTVIDMIPDGLQKGDVTYSIGEKSYNVLKGSGNAIVIIDIPKDQTLTVTVETYADKLKVGEKEREVKNKVTVKAEGIETIEANTLTHIITADASNHKYEYQDANDTYQISGTVWIDADENGQRDDHEETVSGVQTMLVNGQTGEIISETTTNQAGGYTFGGLEKGKYMVAFAYDSGIYTITDYRKTGVNESRNSDAIENNSDKMNAMTDNITIASMNAYNIDLGLVLRNKFDLSLTKTIDKITVKTTKGTKNYNYDAGTKLAKIDIAPKRIDGANVVVQYKITVKNEGNVPGFAKKIVDYAPSQFKFSSSLNKQWYQAENGEIYNSSLADELIQPGEEKEITLTLTKTMTEESTGVVCNTAEIEEDYNDLGLTDINSTLANKAQNENDLGTADILLTVNTGETILYIGIMFGILVLLAGGIVIIKKKVLTKI